MSLMRAQPAEARVANVDLRCPLEGGPSQSNTWGRRGATSVRLALADKRTMRKTIALAWANVSGMRGSSHSL